MKYINGADFAKMIEYAQVNLTNNKRIIDDLNVFPVPDGDTGTNMSLTFTAGYENIKNMEGSIAEISKAFSRGLLMGARGNSGVITSQIFRGMATVFENEQEVDCFTFVKALISASDTAYKGVMSPVEGTILTVIRETSIAMKKHKNCSDFKQFMQDLVDAATVSLDNTPNLLPVLKEAGVVDSGGFGLLTIFKGFLMFVNGEVIETSEIESTPMQTTEHNAEGEFGYCTEFIIKLDLEKVAHASFNEAMLKQQLVKIGDSLVVVVDEDIVKVHVHTLVPGEALNIGQKYGEFLKLKIENMSEQHNEIIEKKVEVAVETEYAIIAVSNGDGIDELFKELGVNYIINGGQTMNPSASDFVELINKSNAKNIIILPNNSNIILAAEQAKSLVDKNVAVIPTKSIMQGLAALSFYSEEVELEVNVEDMQTAYATLAYGEVTYAVRDTTMNGVEVKSGDFIALTNKKLISSVKDVNNCALALIDELVDDESELLTVIYGSDISKEVVENLENAIATKYPELEITINNGKQDIYSYYISCE